MTTLYSKLFMKSGNKYIYNCLPLPFHFIQTHYPNVLTLTSFCKSRGFRRTQFLYLFICFLEKKIIYWEQYNIKITYCTEFYLKKKNHSSKLLLVNSHSFTSLMFPCSNLLGFSSFWLHCTGTRFWNQEKKRSMDMQSVSHSPEGHRLPCHCSNSHQRLCSAGFPTPGQILSWGTPGPRAGPSCKPHRAAWGEEPSDWKCPQCCPPRATGADGAHNHSAIHQHPSCQLPEGH